LKPEYSIATQVKHFMRDERIRLWSILILALLLRIGVVFVFPADVVREDADGYVLGAQRLLAAEGYAYGDGSGLLVPPLYSIFLAGVFALFGPSLVAVRLVQALLAIASYGLIYAIAKGWFNEKVGVAALFLSAFYPALVPWHGFILTETLYMFTIALFFFFLYRLSQNLTWHDALLCGFSLGLTLLTREMLLFFPILLVPALFVKMAWRIKIMELAVLVLLGTLLVLTPWLWRNYKMTEQIVYTSRVSYVLYNVTGQGYLSPKYAAVVAGESDPPSEETLARWEKYGNVSENLNLSFILSQPGTFIRRMFNRFIEYWFHPNGLWSLPDIFVVRALYIAGHAVLVLLAGVGIGITLSERNWSTWGLIAVLLYITGLNLTTYGPNPRYNLPFLPIVFIFAARGALVLYKRFALRTPSAT
jgi:4-amino-4-deoxy-L-arabinose transferase-like glycosyltransferase